MISSGPLFIFIAAILWGVDGILRRSLYSLPPATIVFFEHLIGAILILPFFLKAWRSEKLTKKEWQAISVVALFSGVLGTLFFTTALAKINFIPFSVVFLIQKLQPIFTVATAALILKEHITKKYLLWAGVALAAGYFVTFPGGIVNTGEGGGYIIAAVYALLAAICWGGSTALSRYALLNHSHTLITALRFIITVPLALLFVLALGSAPSLTEITSSQLLMLVGIAFTSGLVALWIYYRGLKYTKASVSTIVELAFPLTAVFIDYFLYDTVLATSQYIAAVVLLYAAYRVAKLNKNSA